jgi:hypothetical protein
MEMTLKRISYTDDGVLGVLLCGNAPVALTLEEEWKSNQSNISCIPPGSYLCRKVTTPKHGVTFEVQDVPGRGSILFHSGNTEEDTMGCILTGCEYGTLMVKDEDTGAMVSKHAVLRSKEAFNKFMAATGGKETIALHIRTC